jgi:hypothetical protein
VFIQNDFRAYGMFGVTVHLSCTDTDTISKQIKTRFHMTHVMYQFHRVHPKRFLTLWYARRKSCTYLAPTLALSPYGPKIPHDPRQLGVPSCATKMIFEPMVRSAQNMHLSCNKISTTSKQTETSFYLSLDI